MSGHCTSIFFWEGGRRGGKEGRYYAALDTCFELQNQARMGCSMQFQHSGDWATATESKFWIIKRKRRKRGKVVGSQCEVRSSSELISIIIRIVLL